jgi:hypothetical protein
MLMAWNNRNLPLHNGVLPPFLYGKGFHIHWIINEAVFSEFRLVFDASRTISFSLLIILNTGLNSQAEDPVL